MLSPHIWVKDGIIHVRTGTAGDKVSLVVPPGAPVEVFINGQRASGEISLSESDQIQVFFPPSQPSRLETAVLVAKDKMTATLQVNQFPQTSYSLPDCAPQQHLVLQPDKHVEKLDYTQAVREQLEKALQEAGVRSGIDYDMLLEAFATGQALCIARGIPARAPEDDRLVYLFADFGVETAPDAKIDFFEKEHFPIIASGTVILEKIPAIHGSVGKNVLGQDIPVKPPKVKNFLAAQDGSVQVSPDGLKVSAAIGGIPYFDGTKIGVKPVCEIPGNANVNTTGNIDFPGTVIVKGHVENRVKIWSTQNIEVMGDVEHATLDAEEQILIHGKVIQSTLTAGGEAAVWLRILPELERFAEQIGQWQAAYQETLERAPQLQHVPPRKVLGGLLQTVFTDLPELTKSLWETIAHSKRLQPQDSLKFKITAAMVLNIYSDHKEIDLAELARGQTELAELLEMVRQFQGAAFDILIPYAQQSALTTSGNILVLKEGCYNSELQAGRDVRIEGSPGYFREGLIKAGGHVVVKELGTPNASQTRVEVASTGRIQAGRVHPGVTIRIGEQEHVFMAPAQKLEAYQGPDGELVIT